MCAALSSVSTSHWLGCVLPSHQEPLSLVLDPSLCCGIARVLLGPAFSAEQTCTPGTTTYYRWSTLYQIGFLINIPPPIRWSNLYLIGNRINVPPPNRWSTYYNNYLIHNRINIPPPIRWSTYYNNYLIHYRVNIPKSIIYIYIQ